MDNSLYLSLVIIIMAVVTYPLRMMPATVFSKARFGRYMHRVLYIMPYAALTALVFPGVFSSVGSYHYAAVAGTAAALILSLFKTSLSVTVVLSVVVVYLVLVLF